MKLIIDIPEHIYNSVKTENCFLNGFEICETKKSIANGIPLEEFDNPCIYCGDNCCGAEYEDKRCECQKVFIIKENKE